MPPITPIHPVQAKDGRSYRRLAPAVQELMGGKEATADQRLLQQRGIRTSTGLASQHLASLRALLTNAAHTARSRATSSNFRANRLEQCAGSW
jgi:hypothetical protein